MKPEALPSILPISVVLACHPSYDKEKMKQCEAFYEGGDKFEAIKDSILFRNGDRNIKAVQKMRDERKDCAYYVPHPAGLIEFFLSCLFQVKPSLLVKDPTVKPPKAKKVKPGETPEPPATPQPSDNPEVKFWNALSANAGNGKPLASQIRNATKDAYVYDRGFLMWSIAKPTKEYKTKPEQKKDGGFDDVTIVSLKSPCVENWDYDEDEESLLWIRYHECEYVQDSPFEEVKQYRDTWTYISDTAIIKYEAVRELINGSPREWDMKKDKARRVGEPILHDYGVCPVTEIADICVMSKLLKPSIALFNNEAALQYAIYKTAFSWLCFFTEKDVKEIFLAELAALKFMPNDKVEVKGPDAQSIPALERQCDRSKDNLYSTVQSLALQSPSKDQGDRQSGQAKKIDRASIFSLLCTHADKVLAPVMKLVNQLKDVRGDSVELSVAGLDSFDIDSKEKKLFIAEQYLALAGIPESARKWVMESLSLAVCETAPAAVRERIRAEIEASQKPEPPGAGVPAGGGPGGQNDPTKLLKAAVGGIKTSGTIEDL